MRIIKFRGKDEKGNWHYGDLEHSPIGRFCRIHEYRDNGFYKWHADVDPDTVGQYTGLTDKHGKEIYEGDIIQHRDVKLIVEFYRGAFGYSRTIERRYRFHVLQESVFVPFIGSGSNKDALQFSDGTIFDTDYCEVVGNIHDNPEMIEEVSSHDPDL